MPSKLSVITCHPCIMTAKSAMATHSRPIMVIRYVLSHGSWVMDNESRVIGYDLRVTLWSWSWRAQWQHTEDLPWWSGAFWVMGNEACTYAMTYSYESWVMRHESLRVMNPEGSELQPMADRVAQNLEIISKNFQFSTRRTRIHHLWLGTNRQSHGQNSGSLKKF